MPITGVSVVDEKGTPVARRAGSQGTFEVIRLSESMLAKER